MFTAQLVDALGAELRRGGPISELLPAWEGDPCADAVPLRICGALHALALNGDHTLAALYPPRAAGFDAAAIIPAVNRALDRHGAHFRATLAHPPQTNEIGRAAVLIGGFSAVVRCTGKPLALLEIGASAGLNLRWDRYRYEFGRASWGDPTSPICIVSQWRGAAPLLQSHIPVVRRQACDLTPIDPGSRSECLRLKSYVWPEQTERLARLDAALELARGDDIRVEQRDAADWVELRLRERRADAATVLYHSIVWQYLSGSSRQRLMSAIDEAGARAAREAPFAWLRFEFESGNKPPTLALTLWPGAHHRVLATAHPHGAFVDWLPANTVSVP